VESIQDTVFSGCIGLTSITSLNVVPPSVRSYTFYGISDVCLKVPQSSIDVYKSADNWKYFSCILDLDGNAATVTITFNANGGAVTPASATTGASGTLASLPEPARDGYTFNGWFTAATDGTRVTTSTQFSGSATIYAQWTIIPTDAVASPDRLIPQSAASEVAAVVPISALTAEFTVGPNPAGALRSTPVQFFRSGAAIKSAALRVYDASGNSVKKIFISDKAAGGSGVRRSVGSWDLRDSKGRAVSAGTYVVRGVLKTSGGKSERVSVVVGVR